MKEEYAKFALLNAALGFYQFIITLSIKARSCKDFQHIKNRCGVAITPVSNITSTHDVELSDMRIDSVTDLPLEFEYHLTEDGGAIVTRRKDKTIPTLSSGK